MLKGIPVGPIAVFAATAALADPRQDCFEFKDHDVRIPAHAIATPSKPRAREELQALR